MQKISPFMWFDNQAVEAAEFYTTVFKNSKIVSKAPAPDGSFTSVTFELEGVEFMALNAGPQFTFNEAISFFVKCKDQQEVDYYWEKLTTGGGEESQCGWLKDKYGVFWQIIPDALNELLSDPDPEKSSYALNAMLKMRKIIVADLTK